MFIRNNLGKIYNDLGIDRVSRNPKPPGDLFPKNDRKVGGGYLSQAAPKKEPKQEPKTNNQNS